MILTTEDTSRRPPAHLRPVARWVCEHDGKGGDRLVMQWSVPDPDVALTGLTALAPDLPRPRPS